MNWWKALSIILIIYALVVGMLIPLRPGIYSASPGSAKAGQILQLSVEGYNTNFSDHSNIRAWLKTDEDQFIMSTSISSESATRFSASFQIPNEMPSNQNIQDVTLLVDTDEDGTMVFPSAVFISKDTSAIKSESSTWMSERPSDLGPRSGFLFPYRNILVETIRNTFYHVSLWFAMFIILFISVIYSGLYLIKRDIDYDRKANALVWTGVLFGILGLATGSIWARFTWGTFWTTDVKLNMAAISMLIYVGYLILRQAIEDRDRRATASGAYAIFAYFAMIPLLFVVPRLTDSLHPGNGGNPGLGGEDLDHTLRIVFYPTIIGFTLFGLWLSQLTYRLAVIKDKLLGI